MGIPVTLLQSLRIAAVACVALCGCSPGPHAPGAAASRPQEHPAVAAAASEPAGPEEQAERLVRHLSAESFRDREAATRELLKMGAASVPVLRRHEGDADLEVRHRVQYLLIQLDPPLLSTQQFESGELVLEDTDPLKLEKLLEDLNRRREYSRSQSDADTSPDIPYLTNWIERVQRELHRRAGNHEGAGGR